MKKFIVLLAAMIMSLAPTAAQAHEIYVYQGSDYVRVGSGHATLWVNDLECDSHSVYAQVSWPYEGITARYYDHGGCASGSEQYSSIPSGTKVVKLCEYYDETGKTYCSINYDF